MARTPSAMIQLGTDAPDFLLLDPVNGQMVSRNDLRKSKGLLVIFMCNHCPFVKHILPGLQELGRTYQHSDIGLVAINSNDAEQYPDDAPEKMGELQLGFSYLYDEDQSTARNYGAACTPDFFLYDENLKLVYRGQFDDSRPGNDSPVTGKDLREAMESLIQGKTISPEQTPSLGCNIKWKSV
jgi:thiol-disulfide isomerase/thioredoxin